MPSNFIAKLNGFGRPGLWIDDYDYAADLLSGGAAPYTDATAYLHWRSKAQGLLRSDVISIPVGRVCGAWLRQDPGLRQEMSAKRRVSAPLRALLGNERLNSHLARIATAIRASFSDRIFVLSCPAPGDWVAEAYGSAFGNMIEPAPDDVDSAAVYISGFLGTFAEIALDGLLLVEGRHSSGDAALRSLYQPILNKAAHYRWDAGLYPIEGSATAASSGMSFAFDVAATPSQSATVLRLDDAFWETDNPVPEADSYYLKIPVSSRPEFVIQKLDKLRSMVPEQ